MSKREQTATDKLNIAAIVANASIPLRNPWFKKGSLYPQRGFNDLKSYVEQARDAFITIKFHLGHI